MKNIDQMEAVDGRACALDTTNFGRGGLYVITPEAVAGAELGRGSRQPHHYPTALHA